MPALSPQIIELRQTLYLVVQRLFDSGHFMTEKAVVRHVYEKTQKHNVATGLPAESFEKFYEAYTNLKRAPYLKQEPRTNPEDLLEFPGR